MSRGRGGVYVEAYVRCDLETLWRLTQDPGEHVRWDLRFSRITPERDLPGGGHAFTYERSLGLHVIRGTGTTIGERVRADGVRTSALRFDTDDPWSPLRHGRGYWRYVPEPGGVRFSTGYDYEPGFGRLADRVLRPLVVWMTAWSFDRLRIWAETGESPERWGVASVLAIWRPARPRASRCRTTPPERGAFADAPATLAALKAP
ncbi:SRPBCC family protein [Agromyces sp. CFH 90414]|uniref:SRPBCC family protein n=1 Tax=Agromyces agglutinans TaxID=2662258 RepID=A0A6I2FJD7_9MICO|nr:SRPBCC family protein [Agromyces agglutinans]MRG60818.1 SRPBCC family protein [Agromyces agglutinans]